MSLKTIRAIYILRGDTLRGWSLQISWYGKLRRHMSKNFPLAEYSRNKRVTHIPADINLDYV